MKYQPQPTFGETIRGLRMGFNWSPELGKFVRLSGKGPFTVDLAHPGLIPNRKGGIHIVWWENKETADLLIKAIKECGIPSGTFVLDDNGKVI